MSSRFTLVPISGLCNRMRVVCAAFPLAQSLDRPIRIVWQSTPDCRARFDQLFQPLPISSVHIEAGTWRDTPATKWNLYWPLLYRKLIYQKELRCFNPAHAAPIAQLAARHSRLFLSTCYALAPYPPDSVAHVFRPLPALADLIDEQAAQFTPKTVGVHIRRTDNRQAILGSPLLAFTKRMDALLQTGEADRFFLSTDDADVKRHFQKLYGDRLLTRSIHFRRDQLAGMQDAVVDLWLLARTCRILGSYFSSYSDTAAELSGAPFEVITRHTS